MYIDLDNINKSDFSITERQHERVGDVVLIRPKPGKHFWELDELHLRSLLCRPDGEIICSGFPKFMNYGERPELDTITRRGIVEGNTYFAEKMDGSLIIRTVIDGHVCFRTRGSHNLGDFEDGVMRMVHEEYSRLLDPGVFPGYSMLFEYTSPDNKIVVEYEESRLTTLGVMELPSNHLFPRPAFVGNPELLVGISKATGVNTPQFYNLPNNIEGLTAEIAKWKNAEGIVVWMETPNGMHLAKIKAQEYIRLHALKYQLTDEKIRKLCYAADITSEQQLKDYFFQWGLDWESASFVLPTFEEYISQRGGVQSEISEFLSRLESEGVSELPTQKRKALKLKEICGKNKRLFAVGISHVTGQQEKAERAQLAYELGITVGSLSSYQESAKELLDALGERFGERDNG